VYSSHGRSFARTEGRTRPLLSIGFNPDWAIVRPRELNPNNTTLDHIDNDVAHRATKAPILSCVENTYITNAIVIKQKSSRIVLVLICRFDNLRITPIFFSPGRFLLYYTQLYTVHFHTLASKWI
jgi:hypothetical protein